MTGYFDALLRSGGLFESPRPVAGPPGRTEADPFAPDAARYDRTPVATDTPGPASAHRPAETSTEAPRPIPGSRADEPAARVEETRPADPPARLKDARAIPEAGVPDGLSEQGAQASGHARVQAALRWVAAAPTKARAEGGLPEEHAQAPSYPAQGVDSEAFAIDARSTGQGTVTEEAVEASSPSQPRAPSLAPDRETRSEPVRSVRAERTVGQAAEPTAPVHRSAASRAREETVEVSIGAIHVRVDAPQMRVGTPSVAPKPASRLACADRSGPQSASHNSRLARRGLRRI